MGEANLDALLLELERDVQDEDLEPAIVPVDTGPEVEAPVVLVPEHVDNQPVLPPDPGRSPGPRSPVNRSTLVAKYVTALFESSYNEWLIYGHEPPWDLNSSLLPPYVMAIDSDIKYV